MHELDRHLVAARSACSSTAELRPARSGQTFEVVNPATEETIGVVADGGPDDLDDAVAAARRAFDQTGLVDRYRVTGPRPPSAAGGLHRPCRRASGP